jgi:hypothetical protein
MKLNAAKSDTERQLALRERDLTAALAEQREIIARAVADEKARTAKDMQVAQVAEAEARLSLTNLTASLEEQKQLAAQRAVLADRERAFAALDNARNKIRDTETKLELCEQRAKSELEMALAKASHDNKVEYQLQLARAIRDRDEQHERATKVIMENCRQLQQDAARNAGLLEATTRAYEDAKKQVVRQTPADIGNAGEREIESFLQGAFGGYVIVRDVSRSTGQLDLDLKTRDNTVTIRIDTKNYAGTFLREEEITRFHRDVDALKPPATAAILFMRPSLRGDVAQSNLQTSRRGPTLIFHIGRWSRDVLLECVIDTIVQKKLEEARGSDATKPFHGAPEVSAALAGMCDLIQFLNETTTRVATAARDAAQVAPAKNRQVVDLLKAAHAVSPQAVSRDLLTKFENQLPKQIRGWQQRAAADQTSAAPKGKRQRVEQKERIPPPPPPDSRKPAAASNGKTPE